MKESLKRFLTVTETKVTRREEEYLDNILSGNVKVNRKLYPILLRLIKNERGREGYLRVFGRLMVINTLLRDVENFLKRKTQPENEVNLLERRIRKVIPWIKKRPALISA